MKPLTSPTIPSTDTSAMRLESASAQSGVWNPQSRMAFRQRARMLAPCRRRRMRCRRRRRNPRRRRVVSVADFHLDVLASQALEQRGDLRIRAIDERNHLQQLVEGNRNRRSPGGEVLHVPSPASSDLVTSRKARGTHRRPLRCPPLPWRIPGTCGPTPAACAGR